METATAKCGPPLPAQCSIQDVLARADPSEVAGRRVKGYPRGLRRRLGLAVALMRHPPVLLLDEALLWAVAQFNAAFCLLAWTGVCSASDDAKAAVGGRTIKAMFSQRARRIQVQYAGGSLPGHQLGHLGYEREARRYVRGRGTRVQPVRRRRLRIQDFSCHLTAAGSPHSELIMAA